MHKVMSPETLKPLTKHQEAYCRARADGRRLLIDCYAEAYPTARTHTAKEIGANKLEKKPHIQARIAELRKALEDETTLTRLEKRQFLARVVRATPDSIADGADRDLAEEVRCYYDKEGNLTRKVYKLPSKTQAIEIDNKMMGHNEPEKIDVRVSGGVLMIPMGGATLDEWEKMAVKQQEALAGEVIDVE